MAANQKIEWNESDVPDVPDEELYSGAGTNNGEDLSVYGGDDDEVDEHPVGEGEEGGDDDEVDEHPVGEGEEGGDDDEGDVFVNSLTEKVRLFIRTPQQNIVSCREFIKARACKELFMALWKNIKWHHILGSDVSPNTVYYRDFTKKRDEKGWLYGKTNPEVNRGTNFYQFVTMETMGKCKDYIKEQWGKFNRNKGDWRMFSYTKPAWCVSGQFAAEVQKLRLGKCGSLAAFFLTCFPARFFQLPDEIEALETEVEEANETEPFSTIELLCINYSIVNTKLINSGKTFANSKAGRIVSTAGKVTSEILHSPRLLFPRHIPPTVDASDASEDILSFYGDRPHMGILSSPIHEISRASEYVADHWIPEKTLSSQPNPVKMAANTTGNVLRTLTAPAIVPAAAVVSGATRGISQMLNAPGRALYGMYRRIGTNYQRQGQPIEDTRQHMASGGGKSTRRKRVAFRAKSFNKRNMQMSLRKRKARKVCTHQYKKCKRVRATRRK